MCRLKIIMDSHNRYVQCLCNAFYVADREDFALHGIARTLIVLTHQSGCMVRTDGTAETYFVI